MVRMRLMVNTVHLLLVLSFKSHSLERRLQGQTNTFANSAGLMWHICLEKQQEGWDETLYYHYPDT